jgi:RimJ/RimL family protein N-acetyltransferase
MLAILFWIYSFSSMTTIIETERLILRTWKTEDAEAYFQINQDPKVTEFLRGPLTMEQVKDFIIAVNSHQDKHGYTLWAACLKESAQFMRFIGLQYIDYGLHFTPAVEVGWRLGSQYWGKGYATEGARAAVDHGFQRCGLKEIVSFTVPMNLRSIRVMEKIGLKRDFNGDFSNPKVPLGHPLSHSILYRLPLDAYLKGPL